MRTVRANDRSRSQRTRSGAAGIVYKKSERQSVFTTQSDGGSWNENKIGRWLVTLRAPTLTNEVGRKFDRAGLQHFPGH